MKVGDLVKFPCGDKVVPIGIVLRTDPDGINRGAALGRRIKVYWIQDQEISWEPIKWMEVISLGAQNTKNKPFSKLDERGGK